MAALRLVFLTTIVLVAFYARADVWLADGYEVEIYGHAPVIPGAIDFDNAGALFVGNEQDGINVPIYRIAPGGGEGHAYGHPLPDPDTVVVDKDGVFYGTPGAVLVGGNNGPVGYVAVILPGGATEFVWSSLKAPDNMGRMTFDTNDRLLLSAGPAFGTYRSPNSNHLPSFLAGSYEDGPQAIATDANDRFYTSSSEGTISFYSSAGEVIDLNFTSNLGFVTDLAIGPGSYWGSDLYANNTVGELYRIDANGHPTLIGSGFNRIASITFGPENALYIADFDTGDILRLTISPPCPWDLNGDGTTGTSDLLVLFGFWGIDPGGPPDFDGDGTVNTSDLLMLFANWGPCK